MQEASLTIRQATPADAQALSLIGQATFLETYAHMIRGVDLLAHCAHRHSTDCYTAWLGDPSVAIWIAETDVQSPVGYLVLTRATLPDEAPQPDDLEIQRIYVLSRFHRTGLGFALMNLAVARANGRGARRLVLGVLAENARALAFYHRQGFADIGTRSFQVGESVFSDKVLARSLR